VTAATEAPAGAPALAVAPVCETIWPHALTGVEDLCEDPAVTADLLARSCGCVPVAWSYSCRACAAQGAARGFACAYCWGQTVSVLCTVPVGTGRG
jgi:hypothetical protein